jgi:hypothetical protein
MRTVLLNNDGSLPTGSIDAGIVEPRVGVTSEGALKTTATLVGDINVDAEFPPPDSPTIIINDNSVGDTSIETRSIYTWDTTLLQNNYFFFRIKIVTGTTAPGAGKNIRIYWDWHPTIILNVNQHYNPYYFDIDLPNSTNTTIYVHMPVSSRVCNYLHYWWVIDALEVNATIDVEVIVVPLYHPPDVNIIFDPENPIPVTIPIPVPVTGTFWQAIQPVSGTVAVSSVAGSVAVTGTFWQATQPVSIANTTKDPIAIEKTSLVQDTWTQLIVASTKATYLILGGFQAKVGTGVRPTENAGNVYLARKSGSDHYTLAKIESGKTLQIGLTGLTDGELNVLWLLADDAGGSDGVTGEYQPTS